MAETILGFLRAENERDWETYRRYLDADVEWEVYGPPHRRTIRGREAYLTAIQAAYAGAPSTFAIVAMAVDEEKQMALVGFELRGRRSVCVFELRSGLIVNEREYFDDLYWTTSLRSSP